MGLHVVKPLGTYPGFAIPAILARDGDSNPLPWMLFLVHLVPIVLDKNFGSKVKPDIR